MRVFNYHVQDIGFNLSILIHRMNDVFKISKIKTINKTGTSFFLRRQFTKCNKMHIKRHAVHDLTSRTSHNQAHKSSKKTGFQDKKDP